MRVVESLSFKVCQVGTWTLGLRSRPAQEDAAAPGTGSLSGSPQRPCREGRWQRDSVTRQHAEAQAGRRLGRSSWKWGCTFMGETVQLQACDGQVLFADLFGRHLCRRTRSCHAEGQEQPWHAGLDQPG